MQFLTSTQLARAEGNLLQPQCMCWTRHLSERSREVHTGRIAQSEGTPVSTVPTKAQTGVNCLLQEAWFHSLTTTSRLVHAEEGAHRRVQTKLLFSLWNFSSLRISHKIRSAVTWMENNGRRSNKWDQRESLQAQPVRKATCQQEEVVRRNLGPAAILPQPNNATR